MIFLLIPTFRLFSLEQKVDKYALSHGISLPVSPRRGGRYFAGGLVAGGDGDGG